MIAVGAILAIIIILIVLLVTGGSSNKPERGRRRLDHGEIDGAAKHHKATARGHRPTPTSDVLTLSLTPTASVYVCLLGDGGRKLIPGVELQAGPAHRDLPRQALRDHARQQRRRTRPSTAKPRTVPASSTAIGYSITKAHGRRTLPPAQQPTCK